MWPAESCKFLLPKNEQGVALVSGCSPYSKVPKTILTQMRLSDTICVINKNGTRGCIW